MVGAKYLYEFVFSNVALHSIFEIQFVCSKGIYDNVKKNGWRRIDCVNFNVHTFGIPNHGCPRDILDESLTNGRCSGSEMHGCTYLK